MWWRWEKQNRSGYKTWTFPVFWWGMRAICLHCRWQRQGSSVGHLTGAASTRGSLLTDALSRLCNGTILWLAEKITRRHPALYPMRPREVLFVLQGPLRRDTYFCSGKTCTCGFLTFANCVQVGWMLQAFTQPVTGRQVWDSSRTF